MLIKPKVVHALAQVKICSPTCQSFKCAKNAALYRRDSVWCRWTEEMCNVSNCTYAICVKRRLLPRGVCGETVKRKTVERQPDEVVGLTIKLRGRAIRKIKDREIF
ncbi:hypothetical protein HXY32_07825 [Candidatus Bathyarchaeota archaeon]|nr:hypothetical protein [Candidatus Bathyarchaeota archaeon]